VKKLLPRPQQRLLNQLRSNSDELDDSDDEEFDDTDLQIGYRRPTLEKCSDKCRHDDEDDLSDYIIVRLALARAKAIKLYREKHNEPA